MNTLASTSTSTSTSTSDVDTDARLKLIDAGSILDAADQGDLTRGHVSVRVPGDALHFYMKPHIQGLDEITPENIVVCNLDGE